MADTDHADTDEQATDAAEGVNEQVTDDQDAVEATGDVEGDTDTADDDSTAETDAQDDDTEATEVEQLKAQADQHEQRADALAHRLHSALVAADGRLADPDDLPFNAEHLDDTDALSAAIGDLIARKPGLKAQNVTGDVGAGKRGSDRTPPADLLKIIQG